MPDAHEILDDALNEQDADEIGVPEEYSDEALALRFSECHQSKLKFVDGWGRWFVWSGTHWHVDDSRMVIFLAREIAREASSELADRGKEFRHLARAIASHKTVMAIEKLARADRRHASTVNQWDRDLLLLNTMDGTIDLRTGKLKLHDPKDLITKVTRAKPDGDCPRWKAFLNSTFDNDTDLIEFVQRVLGYSLTGLIKEHALFFCYGTGANGKSVLLNTVMSILGDYSDVAPIDAFVAHRGERHPTDLADLRGLRLVVAQETEEGQRWAEAKLKLITGGDPIKARHMRQDFFTFNPQFTLIIAGNHKPSLRSIDEATRRRFNLIPFNTTIPRDQRNPDLEAELKKEWPGILAWLIEGCLAYQRGRLNPPGAITSATDAYLNEEDGLGRFIDECCEITHLDNQLLTEVKNLFDEWKNWCETAGEREGSLKNFSRNLEARGFEHVKHPKTRRACFSGISLRK